MPVLQSFALPAQLPEPADADRAAWNARVGRVVADLADAFPQFFDPTATDIGPDAMAPAIAWTAFPATLLEGRPRTSSGGATPMPPRQVQDEYCEWGVERDRDGVLTRVTFTTEVPEYFDHLAARDEARLLATYHELVGPHVKAEELVVGGTYRRDNVHNSSTEGRPAHLMQETNTLFAALVLAAQATVLRHDADGEPVTSAMALVRCGRLGEPRRNSDPQIAAAVNDAAATGAEISLQDPFGLYIDRLLLGACGGPTAGIRPSSGSSSGERPSTRCAPATPSRRGSASGSGTATADGRRIEFGAQLAERVVVRLTALVRPAGHRPRRQPCEG